MQANEVSLHLIANVINKNGFIDIPAEGTSMFPFIRKGDVCRFVSCEASTLKKGDVVLFRTSSGRLIAHRYYKAITDGNQTRYVFKGDTNLGFDEAVDREQIMGKLVSIQKDKRTLHAAHLVANLWGAIILSLPVFSQLLRGYLNRKERSQS
jgi:signal peptidase